MVPENSTKMNHDTFIDEKLIDQLLRYFAIYHPESIFPLALIVKFYNDKCISLENENLVCKTKAEESWRELHKIIAELKNISSEMTDKLTCKSYIK
jgi:hypothetical protein